MVNHNIIHAIIYNMRYHLGLCNRVRGQAALGAAGGVAEADERPPQTRIGDQRADGEAALQYYAMLS